MDIKDFSGWGGMFLKFKMAIIPKLVNLLLKKMIELYTWNEQITWYDILKDASIRWYI